MRSKAVRKAFLSFTIIVLLFLGFFHYVRISMAQDLPKVYVDPATSVVEDKGDFFSINVTIANVTGLRWYWIGVIVDPDVLYVNDTLLEEGPFLQSAGATLWDPIVDPDYLDVWCELTEAGTTQSGNGTLFTVTFMANETGRYPIVLDFVELYDIEDDLIACTTEDGEFYTNAPKAAFTYTIGEPVIFNATASYDPDGTIESYEWDFGDLNVTTVYTPIVTHSYEEVGEYNVTLTVTDNATLTDTEEQTLNIIKIRLLDAETGEPTMTASAGQNVTVNATVAGVTTDRGVNGWDFKLRWDPDILYTEAGWVSEGDFLKVGSTNFVKSVGAAEMTVGCNLMEPTTASGSGILASVVFQVVQGGSGRCILNLFESRLLDIDVRKIPHAAEDGVFYTPKPKAKFIYYTEAHPPPSPGVQPLFTPVLGELITFNATDSYDYDGNIVSWQWDFDDETTDSGEIVTHTYTQAGGYNVNLTVTDNEGLKDSQSRSLTVVIHDIAIINMNISSTVINPGQTAAINITVLNEGTEAEYFNLTCSFDSTYIWYNETTNQRAYSSALEYDPDTHTWGISLDPGDNMTRTFIWNTTGVPEAVYTITARASLVNKFADPVPGETDTADNDYYYPDVIVTWGYPVADFTFTPEDPTVDDRVTFDASPSYDLDGTITGWQWDFDGDGVIDVTDEETKWWEYDAAGTYTVNLTVTDNDGKTDSTTKDVTVSPPQPKPPVASFTYSPASPEINEIVTFNATASYDPDGTIESYEWDFGDLNVTTVYTPIVTHKYEEAAHYTVKLTVTDNASLTDSDSKSLTARLPGAPIADFTFTPEPPIGVGQEITFNATDSYDPNGWIVNYTWNLGDGSIITVENKTAVADYWILKHTYDEAGTFQVILNVTDNDNVTASSTPQNVTVLVHDLNITSVTFDPPSVMVGESIAINVTVENPGGFNETFSVTAYYDNDVIDTLTDITLKAENSSVVKFTWNTTGILSGQYTIKAEASEVPYEVNTTNNIKTALDKVTIFSMRDIAVTGIEVSPTTVEVGESVSINVTVENLGDLSETFNVTAYYDNNAIDTLSDISLAAGAETTVNVTWHTAAVAPDTYTIKAEASVVPDEVNTTNNIKVYGDITITGARDIVVTGIEVSPTTVEVGESVSINVTVENLGGLSEIFNITAYYDESVIDTLTDVTLEAGVETTVNVTWHTAAVAPDTYTIKAEASVVPDEVNTTNNIKVYGDITVQKASSTISLTVYPPAITVGESTSISGSITPTRTGANVIIKFKLSGAQTWNNLTTLTTSELSQYSYPSWQITETGIYEVKAIWEGDTYALGSESTPALVTVRAEGEDGTNGYDLFLLLTVTVVGIVGIVGMIIEGAIIIYLLKLRKPK